MRPASRHPAMRPPSRRLTLALATLAAAGLAAAAGAQEDRIAVAVGEWPPYLSESLPGGGLAARLATAAFAAVGIAVDYRFYPWARALAMARAGDLPASLLWVRTDEREADFLFTDVVVTGTTVFYHLKERPFSWSGPGDLRGKVLGGLASASYPWYEKAREAGIGLSMIVSARESDNFRHLLDGDIDLFSLDLLVGAWILGREFGPAERSRITYDPRPVEDWAYRLMVSRAAPEAARWVGAFNRGLARIKADGTWRRILAEFGGGAGP